LSNERREGFLDHILAGNRYVSDIAASPVFDFAKPDAK
jgi:hypothetical protein